MYTKTLTNYWSRTMGDLREECKSKGYKTNGKKIELVKRLFPEIESYKHLDAKKGELFEMAAQQELKPTRKMGWAELITLLNKPDRPTGASITFVMLDGKEFNMIVPTKTTIREVRSMIAVDIGVEFQSRWKGSVRKIASIDLYTETSIVYDHDIVVPNQTYTVIVSEDKPFIINPFTDRTVSKYGRYAELADRVKPDEVLMRTKIIKFDDIFINPEYNRALQTYFKEWRFYGFQQDKNGFRTSCRE